MPSSHRSTPSRRQILLAATGGAPAALALGRGLAQASSSPPPPDFALPPPQVLYSNDTTNITSCESPWRDPREGFTDAHLRATVMEAAGADVHLLQPGLGWIPWWRSEIYSPEEHYGEFLPSHGHERQNPYGRYFLAGGDLVAAHLAACEEAGVLPFVSCRLNDGHHVRGLAQALEEGRPDASMSRFYWENVHRYRIGPDPTRWEEGVFDWSFPEVVEHMAALIEELCANYEFAGLELDFLRHLSRFSPERSTIEERRAITTAFVARMREALDARTYRGQRRWLGARVPARLEVGEEQGIDLRALVEEAGLDFVNLSYTYFTMQDDAVARAREVLPDTPLYLEMAHTTLTGRALAGSGTQPFLRTTAEQYFSTARLAYDQGATGVSLFNFAYYRARPPLELGPFHEPPFEILERLKYRDFLAGQSPWYFLSSGRNDPALGEKPLQAILVRGEPQRFPLWTVLSEDPPERSGLLRLRSDEAIDDRVLEVRFNGVPVEPAPFLVMPIEHPYEAWLGEAEEFACYEVPPGLARAGENEVEALLAEGFRVRLIYLDLTFPA